MPISLRPFYFIRHGETDWNKQHRAMGQQDIPLNDKGIMQAKQAALSLQGLAIQTIVSSPLQRALTTAEIIAETVQKPIICIDDLKEARWGIWEGREKNQDICLDNWKKGASIEAAETFSDFSKRVFTGLNKALEFPGPVLIVSHGGVYWAIQEALKLNKEEDISNGIPIFHRPPEDPIHPWFAYPFMEEDKI